MDFQTNLYANFPRDVADKILASLDEKRTHGLLLNTNKIGIREFYSRFPRITPHPFVNNGFLYNREEYDFGKLFYHDLGVYYLQEPSAMSIVSFLDIKPGEIVLDMCAAPGGKALQASLRTGEKGLVLANDISHSRALVLSSNVERLGLGNIVVTNNDFSSVYSSYLESFDKIILDALCSGSGMFRKDERMMKDWSYNKVIACQKTQVSLLHLAYLMLRPGGVMAYSTCSFSKEENEDVVAALLSDSDAYLSPLSVEKGLYSSTHLDGPVYFLPSSFEGEGHFVAIIKKPGTAIKRIATIPSYRGQHADLIKRFGLENRHDIAIKETLYSLSIPFDVKKLNVLRYGVRCFDEIGKYPKPNHHLATYSNNVNSIELDEVSFGKYRAGETLDSRAAPGYHIVSYQGLSVGFVHAVDGTLKNLYPKGLRRRT